MKRKTTLLIISLFLATPLFYSITMPITVRAQTTSDKLIIGTLGTYINFDPIIGEAGISGQTRGWVFEPLYRIENTDPAAPSFYITPWLVESESIDASGLHVNLTLNQGIEFSNGKPFNASVVKWNLDRQRDVGQSFYGQWGIDTYQAIIQWTWHNFEAFLSIPGNMDYNNSALYPELWWNKDDSRYPPEYWDGTNTTSMIGLEWPRDIGNWTGRSVWNTEELWTAYGNNFNLSSGVMYNASGNWPSGERNSNVYDNVTLYEDDPYLITLNLFFPAFQFWKTTSLYTMSMVFPDGSYNPSNDTFSPDGPMYHAGDKANTDWKTKYMSVLGPAYEGMLSLEDAVTGCIGTGPFTLTDYNPAEKWMTLERNDNYWGGNWQDTNRPGPIIPNMTDVTVQTYDTSEALYTALLDGDIDYCNMDGSWSDYEAQINNKVSLNLSDQFAVGGVFDYHMNPYEIDKTLRYAMSFAFNYEHATDPDIEGRYVLPTKGPWWDALFTDYVTLEQHPIMTHDGSGTEVGFYYNLTEARWWLLHNDSYSYTNQPILMPDGVGGTMIADLPNRTKVADRAAAQGLTDSSTDQDWKDVANSLTPIATITTLDHVDYEHWYDNFKAYMALIGIKVEPYGPITAAEYYPYELNENRWGAGTDGIPDKQTWRSDYFATLPHLLNIVKWQVDNVLGIGEVMDKNDHFAVWNSWPYQPSLINVTDTWAKTQPGGGSYVPTNINMRQLINSFPFIGDDTQMKLDYGTVVDQIYRDAISIWFAKPTGFATLHKAWSWAGRRPDTPYGMSIFDFKQTGWTPPTVNIPGYSMGLLIGITILSIAGVVYVLRKRRM